MSMAAALAADGGRPASLIPSVKCSDCGEELDISEIGQHVCAPSLSSFVSSNHKPSISNPFILKRAPAAGQQYTSTMSPLHQSVRPSSPDVTSIQAGASRGPSQPLPKIDSGPTNGSLLNRRQASLASPRSPAVDSPSQTRPGRKPLPTRIATSPAPRLYDPRPPSPEMTPNLDCAFPPFPISADNRRRPSTPSTNQGRSIPVSGDHAFSRGGSRLDHVRNASQELSNLGPQSPRLRAGQNVLERMNTLRSGPFNSNLRFGNGNAIPESEAASGRKQEVPAIQDSINGPLTPGLEPQPVDEATPQSSPNSSQEHVPVWPARPSAEILNPTFLDKLSMEPVSLEPLPSHSPKQMQSIPVSQTFPPPKHEQGDSISSEAIFRLHSEPALLAPKQRPAPLQGAVSDSAIPVQKPDMSNPPSGSETKNIQRQGSIHASKDSGSSMASAANSATGTDRSGISYGSSAPSSVDASILGPQRYGEDQTIAPVALTAREGERPAIETATSPIQNLPAKDLRQLPQQLDTSGEFKSPAATPIEWQTAPAHVGLDGASSGIHDVPLPHQSKPLGNTANAPALHSRVLQPFSPASPLPEHYASEDFSSQSTHPVGTNRPRAPSVADSQYSSYSATSTQRGPIPRNAQTNALPNRRPTNAKSICRGCRIPIEGKSVKAADGRLTGRWHKACFVCKSCREPFMTADFYVLDNEPYCEQHYHEKNNSLCQGCHRGIEGQYVETSSSTPYGNVDKKYHPRCFVCCQCRVVLAQDFFEITGRVFCERHALAAMRAQSRTAPGLQVPNPRGLMAERRTTRLINPMMA